MRGNEYTSPGPFNKKLTGEQVVGRYITPYALAERMGISVEIVRRKARCGDLPAEFEGKGYLISEKDADDFSRIYKKWQRNYSNLPEWTTVCLERWPECKHYDECLDRHAIKNRKFGCQDCKRFVKAEPIQLEASDIEGCYALLGVVFGNGGKIHVMSGKSRKVKTQRSGILACLELAGEPMTPKAIAQEVGINPAAARKMLSKMELEDLVERCGYGLYTKRKANQ